MTRSTGDDCDEGECGRENSSTGQHEDQVVVVCSKPRNDIIISSPNHQSLFSVKTRLHLDCVNYLSHDTRQQHYKTGLTVVGHIHSTNPRKVQLSKKPFFFLNHKFTWIHHSDGESVVHSRHVLTCGATFFGSALNPSMPSSPHCLWN